MREYGTVEWRFWTGETGRAIKRLGRDAQVAALYLMTCPNSNMIGLYYLPIPVMAHEIGMTLVEAADALSALAEVGFAKYDGAMEIVWVITMGFYQTRLRTMKVQDKRWVSVRRILPAYAPSPLLQEWMSVYGDAWALGGVLSGLGEEERLPADEGSAGKENVAEESPRLDVGKAALTEEGLARTHAEEGHAETKRFAPVEGARASEDRRAFEAPSKPESREQRAKYKSNPPLPPSSPVENINGDDREASSRTQNEQRQKLPMRRKTKAKDAQATAKTTAKAGRYQQAMAKAHEAGLDTVSLSGAAGRALRGCGISDERMLPVVIAAFELECTRMTPAVAEALAIDNWKMLQNANGRRLLLYPPSERKFFKMGLWADVNRFPWDPKRRNGL